VAKVYRSNNKLVVYLPFDLIADFALKEGDELDFFKHEGYYIVAKKSTVADMITGRQAVQQPAKPTVPQAAQKTVFKQATPNAAEMALLKKLDTVRYNDRTKDKINSMLSADERKVAAEMLKKKYVELYKKSGESDFKYSIPKSIYDSFLMRKKPAMSEKKVEAKPQPARQAQAAPQPSPKRWEQSLGSANIYLKRLEANGYLVINSETEASAASAALEDSIRRGLVVGIRAFNKKFYIATKAFITKSLPKIGKMIGSRGISVSDITKETGVEEDGVRAILYIMAEAGDVTEIRKDVFKEA
jgi:hypothetical protein